VDQDPLGYQGRRVKKSGTSEVWSKQMADGSRTVILFNRGSGAADVNVAWTDLGYPEGLPAAVRDLWEHRDLGTKTRAFSASVPGHGVVMVSVRPVTRP
jgi:alpha-galactosidase